MVTYLKSDSPRAGARAARDVAGTGGDEGEEGNKGVSAALSQLWYTR
jgi:hypothetical protein